MAHSRIDDLRRRVEADPASIAFAQLAEEYRRAGQTEEAVRVSREGLTRHPGYLSARVTLGRALLDLGQLSDARTELQFVATEAPENLAAVRGLAEIFHREGDAASALEYFQRALSLARHDPELEEIVQQLSRQVGAEAGPSSGLSFEEAHQELLSAADRVPLAPAAATADSAPAAAGDPQGTTAPFDFDTLVAALGTPAAPPLVEAVVRGETPEVFELSELPELPEASGLPMLTDTVDPFAVLEAELRAHPTAEADAAPAAAVEPADAATEPPVENWLTSVALADDTAAAAWTATESDGAAVEPNPPAVLGVSEPIAAPEGVDDPLLALDASLTALLVPEGGRGEEPDPAGWPSGADDASLSSERVVTEMSGLVEEALAPGDSDPVLSSEALMPEDAPAESVAAGLADGAIDAAVEEASAADADLTAPAPMVEAQLAASSADHRSVAADRRDDVLGDLEDWLSTLQDRSEP